MTVYNPFDDPETANNYESWYQTVGQRADRQEKSLLKWLLNHFPTAHTILEVGCGTGYFTRWVNSIGNQVVGLDLSINMLKEANIMNRQKYILGDALHLPFSSKSFDLTMMVTTLEFLTDPVQSLTEALRIARHGLILGVINEQSLLGQQYKKEGGHIWNAAQFYTPNELIKMLDKIYGGKPKIIWRTTLWPLWPCSLPLPWGGFIGLGAINP